ncbi:MAG: mannose-1-phosphate guanyltransferase [bacterium]|nr:mannose-1-phosphate guanyltransferase [bacterium]
MKGVIMAGGFGTRLRPLTCNIPKPMVPLANKPIMEHIVTLLKRHEIKELIVILYYQPEVIMDYFGDGEKFGVNITYVTATQDFGTAGSVKNATKHLTNEPFLIISGDVLTDFDLSDIIKFHKEKKAQVTITTTVVANPLQYGIIIIDSKTGRINRFLEKPSWGEVFSDTVNTGIYLLEPEVLEHIPVEEMYDFSKDLFPKLLVADSPLYGYIARGYWRDIGNLTEYRLAHYDVLNQQVKLMISGDRKDGIWIDSTTMLGEEVNLEEGVIIGKNCSIGEGVKIINSCIGNNCIIEENSKIINSILWDGVHTGIACELQESVIGKGTHIKKGSSLKEETVVGDGCVIGSDCILRTNVKMWPYKIIEDGATLSASLVWGEKWSRSLFGSRGVVGLANMEITPEFASRLGAAYGASFPKGADVIVSRDSHKASRMINRAIMSGILSVGVNVWDMGVVPVPVARFQGNVLNAHGGLHIARASYDPKLLEIRFFESSGLDLSPAKERAIEQLFYREDFRRVKIEETGNISFPYRVIECYREGLLSAINPKLIAQSKFKIIIDYAFGSISTVFPTVLEGLGCEMVALNACPDAEKAVNTPAGISQSLRQLSNIVLTLEANVGFLFDQEAERIFAVDERGRIIPDDLYLAIMVKLACETIEEGYIGIPVISSRIIAQMNKDRVKYLKINHKQRILDKGFVMAGNGYGGFIFPQFHASFFDGMFSSLKLLEFLSAKGIKLGEVVDSIPDFYVHHERISCAWELKGALMRWLIEETRAQKVELIEGIKVFHRKDWVLLLPDPDEALLHIYAEAGSKEKAEELAYEYVEKINKFKERG